LSDKHPDHITVVSTVCKSLPEDFDLLRTASRSEGYECLERLQCEWQTGVQQFQHFGEMLAIVRIDTQIAAIEGISRDPKVPDAYRMRRFYVLGSYRRMGLGRLLVQRLLEQDGLDEKLITVHAGDEGAQKFWQAMGFTRSIFVEECEQLQVYDRKPA
jgi:ribosomal protein S18 acetylase RimI-like enzyme